MRLERGPELPSGFSSRSLAARMPPMMAVALVVATGTFWYTVTRPVESLRYFAGAPDAVLDAETFALLFSSMFGGVVLVAGLFVIAVYLAERHRRPAYEPLIRRVQALSLHDDPGSMILIKRLHADIASFETRFQTARRSADPREIARAVVRGRHALDDILLELQAAGVHVDEVGAD
jgi:hypothetical protein